MTVLCHWYMRTVQNSGTMWPTSVNCVILLLISQRLVVLTCHSCISWQRIIAHNCGSYLGKVGYNRYWHFMVFVFQTELFNWDIRWLLKAFVIVGYYPPISESCFAESEKCASEWPVKISEETKKSKAYQQSIDSDFVKMQLPHRVALGAGR